LFLSLRQRPEIQFNLFFGCYFPAPTLALRTAYPAAVIEIDVWRGHCFQLLQSFT
jgi:hypothetical protein